jgi:hypothetical protein
MKCSKCKKEAIPGVEYAGNNYCNFHFMELIEKRVRKNLRVRELIDINKEYFLVDDGSSEAKITEYFLNKIFKGYLKLKIGKTPKSIGKETNLILSTNLDEQALIFLNSFLKNQNIKKNKVKEDKIKKKELQEVMPLEVLLQREIKLICEIVNVKFKPRIKENKNILDELEKRHPGTKFSVFQSKMNLLKK